MGGKVTLTKKKKQTLTGVLAVSLEQEGGKRVAS